MSDKLRDTIAQAASEAESLADQVRGGWPPEAAEELASRLSPAAVSSASSAKPAPAADPANSEEALKDRVIEALKTIYDPEIPVNIYDLGLIYGVDIDEDRAVKITMTLTSPHCPVAESMPAEVEARARLVPGTTDVAVELTWEPPWNPDEMSDEAKLELGMF